jgi:hypothetical protein
MSKVAKTSQTENRRQHTRGIRLITAFVDRHRGQWRTYEDFSPALEPLLVEHKLPITRKEQRASIREPFHSAASYRPVLADYIRKNIIDKTIKQPEKRLEYYLAHGTETFPSHSVDSGHASCEDPERPKESLQIEEAEEPGVQLNESGEHFDKVPSPLWTSAASAQTARTEQMRILRRSGRHETSSRESGANR